MSSEGTTRPSQLGRYELITRIGQGGMAEVQLALQRGPAGFEKLVVVKLVHENLATQKAFVDMLLDEARVAALVKHPNVVDIYDLGEVDGRYFIAMEYLEGEPLLSVLRAGREGKRLDVLSTARLIADTAEGLEAAHELRTMGGDPLELVHHDVSLGNIVVLYNGQVKLVDFGVAKATQSASNERRVQGKFSYMAPEKLKGATGDRRSDIWSLGVVLWEALTLKRLFRGGNESDTMRQVLESPLSAPSTINGDVPADLDPIVMRALERDPDARYPSAKEMADDLENVLTQVRYGARNDLIARYMQDTFREHITARKKLLQEVATKGTASTEILDLAFSEPLIASGSQPGQQDFSVKFRRNSMETPVPQPVVRPSESALTLLPEGTPVEVLAQPLPPPPEPIAPPAKLSFEEIPHAGSQPLDDGHLKDHHLSGQMAVVDNPNVSSPRLEIKKRKGEPTIDPMATSMDEPASSPVRVIALIALLAIAGGVAIYWFVLRGDTGPKKTAPPPSASAAGTVTPHESAPPPPAAPEPTKAAPTPTETAEQHYKAGMQELDKGDAAKALALFTKAQAASGEFAPSWRGTGLAQDKLGDKAAAKAAFQKYLQLAPSAADAPQIRAKLETL